MTTKTDDTTDDPKPAKAPHQIKVRANAAVLGLRAFEVAEVTEDDEVKALLANGLLEKA